MELTRDELDCAHGENQGGQGTGERSGKELVRIGSVSAGFERRHSKQEERLGW